LPENISDLIEALKADDVEIRREAAKKLGELKAVEAVPALAERLYTMHEVVLEALKAIGQPCLEKLFITLEKGEFSDRVLAAAALGYIQDASAIPYLIKVLCEEPMCDVTWEAAMALARFGNAAVPSLVHILDHDCDEDAVIAALEKIGTPKALAAVAEWELLKPFFPSFNLWRR
jgi:HEAT repeat protein